MRESLIRVLIVCATAIPVFAQFSGPAVLSRGEAPAAMVQPNIQFRPFLELAATYDTGLSDARLTNGGTLASGASSGIRVIGGISGSKSWKFTTIGLEYQGSYTGYREQTVPRSISQSLLFGVSRQLSRHLNLNLRESAGMFTRDFGVAGLSSTVPFDPSSTFIPTTDYFDNRTYFSSSQAQLTWQKSLRLSINMAGGFITNQRLSSALFSMTGETAQGDFQYRLTRRVTVGGVYDYQRYVYSGNVGGTDIHIFAGSFSMRPTRRLELSFMAGVDRVESTFLLTQSIDPVIAALLGVTSTTQISHTLGYRPYSEGRLSRVFARGVVFVSGGSGVTPGNGVFLTSYSNRAIAGYQFTGLRRWSFSAQGGENWSEATGNIAGRYRGATGTVTVSRSLGGSAHLTSSFSVRQYDSPDFGNYNRLIYNATVGIGFTPGNIPLRIR